MIGGLVPRIRCGGEGGFLGFLEWAAGRRAAARGDAQAAPGTLEQHFDGLVEAHAHGIYAFCLRNVGDSSEAEDLTQATFIEAFRCRSRFREDAPLLPWILGIAANQCRGWHRRRRAAVRDNELVDATPDQALSPDAAYAHEETSRLVRRAVLGLPSPYREVIVLRFDQGLTLREIAGALGLSPEAAAKRLSRGLGMLRGRLEALGL